MGHRSYEIHGFFMPQRVRKLHPGYSLIALGKEYNFELDEVELYPPNEPQFIEAQLSERMAKALLRV